MSVSIDGITVKVGDKISHLTRGTATVVSVSDSHGGTAVAEFSNGSQLPFGHEGTHAGTRVFGWNPPIVLWGSKAIDAARVLKKEFKL